MTQTQLGMQISAKTLEILKNFSTVNTNVLIRPGNSIETIAPSKSLYARATVAESFPVEFGVWELQQFLGIVSLIDKPTFQFNEDHVNIIGANGSTAKYVYSSPSLLTVPDLKKKFVMPPTVLSFVLPANVLKEIVSASSVMQLPDLTIESDSAGGVNLTVRNKSDDTSHTYKWETGVTTSASFTFNLKVENLKLLPDSYTVNVAEKAVQFAGQSNTVEYFVPLEADSTIQK